MTDIINWLRFILHHGWTSYKDYKLLMWEEECKLKDDNSALRELMR